MDRRQHERYLTEGHVQVRVLTSCARARALTVISRSRTAAGSEMRMRISAAGGRHTTLHVRTIGSQPQLVGGQLRYRVWMQVLAEEPAVLP